MGELTFKSAFHWHMQSHVTYNISNGIVWNQKLMRLSQYFSLQITKHTIIILLAVKLKRSNLLVVWLGLFGLAVVEKEPWAVEATNTSLYFLNYSIFHLTVTVACFHCKNIYYFVILDLSQIKFLQAVQLHFLDSGNLWFNKIIYY